MPVNLIGQNFMYNSQPFSPKKTSFGFMPQSIVPTLLNNALSQSKRIIIKAIERSEAYKPDQKTQELLADIHAHTITAHNLGRLERQENHLEQINPSDSLINPLIESTLKILNKFNPALDIKRKEAPGLFNTIKKVMTNEHKLGRRYSNNNANATNTILEAFVEELRRKSPSLVENLIGVRLKVIERGDLKLEKS